MRVVIVDDELWVRHGRAAALGSVSGFEVIELEPRAAIEFGDRWDNIDVALVDAHDAREPFDRFPGVRVVEAIRARRPASETRVIVISGHIANAFLHLRMAEAGADFFYRHADVRDIESLLTAIRSPAPEHRVVAPDATVLARLGLSPGSCPNAALRFLEEEGLTAAFDGRRSQKTLELSRRSIMRVRHEIARLAHLAPSRPTGAARHLDAPEWRAVVDFVNRARGAERRSTGFHSSPSGKASATSFGSSSETSPAGTLPSSP